MLYEDLNSGKLDYLNKIRARYSKNAAKPAKIPVVFDTTAVAPETDEKIVVVAEGKTEEKEEDKGSSEEEDDDEEEVDADGFTIKK